MNTFLKLKDILEMTKISRSEIYRKINLGEFPKPIKIGKMSRWVKSEVEAWMLMLAERRK